MIAFSLGYDSSSPNDFQFLLHESSYHHMLHLVELLIHSTKNFNPLESDVMKTEFSVHEVKGSYLLGGKAKSTGKYPQTFRGCLMLLYSAKQSKYLKC